MNAKRKKRKYALRPLIFAALLASGSSALISCGQPPQSLFERQAEAESANDFEINAGTGEQLASIAPVTPVTIDNAFATSIDIIKQQSSAQQPNCIPTQTDCQYFELNVLSFNPAQPWLTSIMWQTIARVLAPETPLASQDETAKKTVLKLFNQIEYSVQAVDTLPMYQRIDTELILNPVLDNRFYNGSVHSNGLSDSKTDENKNTTVAARNPIATGYLSVRSRHHRGARRQQQLSYVMLDMQKKLQLTIDDILLPQVTTEALLLAFQTAKKDWLTLQGVEHKYLEDWPLLLSKQWYLDAQGLHMVYQSGELLDVKTDAVDLMVPYSLLQNLIKPRYMVQAPLDPMS